MHFPRLTASVVLAFSAAACSDESDSDPVGGMMMTNPNQPAASAGSGGGAGSGSMPSATGGSGGSSEAPPNPMLNQGGGNGNGNGNGGGNMMAGGAGMAGSAAMPPGDAGAPPADDNGMSFFVTSRGVPTGGNFGGLAGADALCDELATAVSAELGAKTWRAYLSTTTVNARDRIGTGPWFNQAGVLVANNLTQLHDQGAGGTLDQTWAPGNAAIALTEQGNQVPNNQHDILTGTLANGTVSANLTCADWTAVTGNVQVGHSNRGGGGVAPSSWSSAHGAPAGCAPIGAPAPNVTSGGGRGSIYCFATD